ncbi:hypothetical protein GCM10011492_12140 [Flexivirga endophytica]|uniref:Uncharacterized protein n=1 Tax=Flexivirga endophytica TaxID=1849103 RepID=A0A916T155_9MICO|nr:hypothetical protein GCM10011492_12140 [Flexivirga endophytica]GHB57774.1 hypothetical protein GCM10008112_28680 [Flexivirga endophytica]
MVSPPTAEQWRRASPFAAIGAVCIVGGGLLAAATAHAPSEHATWAVAYLVLVCGIAQIVVGVGQAAVVPAERVTRTPWAELLAWNLGNAGVIAGTVTDQLWLMVLGSVLLAISLVLFLFAGRGAGRSLLVMVYRAVLAIVLVSIPVGIALAIARG